MKPTHYDVATVVAAWIAALKSGRKISLSAFTQEYTESK
jgi:hypothetical protein